MYVPRYHESAKYKAFSLHHVSKTVLVNIVNFIDFQRKCLPSFTVLVETLDSGASRVVFYCLLFSYVFIPAFTNNYTLVLISEYGFLFRNLVFGFRYRENNI